MNEYRLHNFLNTAIEKKLFKLTDVEINSISKYFKKL